MNELARQNQQTFDFFNPVQFETMQRVCNMFANSELVPDMYKTTDKNPKEKAIANCMIAVEMATRIQASPLMIMQNMVIIYGRPSWSSKFLVATVNTCGRFNPLQYEFKNLGKLGKVEYTEYEKEWVKPTIPGSKGHYKHNAKTNTFDGSNVDNIQCIAFTTAKGSNDRLESSPISIELAVKEGWYTKSGSKWQTMTRQMLMYRAASFWTSAYAPELSMGMRTTEEYEDTRDVIDIDHEEVTDNALDKVEKEIKEQANRQTLNMDETPNPVDTGQPKEQPDPNIRAQSEPDRRGPDPFFGNTPPAPPRQPSFM
jgi:hypothetical protein